MTYNSTQKTKKKFSGGNICMTRGAYAKLNMREAAEILTRHMRGDWGDMCEEDQEINEEALCSGARLMSEYKVNGERYWIITEADRSVTTILLPEEY